MLVGVVTVIITVVVIILLDVSSLATPGTAQTLAHNNSGLPGRKNSVQALGMPASSGQKGAFPGFCSAPNMATLSPLLSAKWHRS